jgi:hypothetical protein
MPKLRQKGWRMSTLRQAHGISHPLNATEEIHFVCLEGNEAGSAAALVLRVLVPAEQEGLDGRGADVEDHREGGE